MKMAKEVRAQLTGNVWKIVAKVGDRVSEGQALVILESMKMEIPVEAEFEAQVVEIRVQEGQAISEGDLVAILG